MAEVTRATREARLREEFTYEELLEYCLDMELDLGWIPKARKGV